MRVILKMMNRPWPICKRRPADGRNIPEGTRGRLTRWWAWIGLSALLLGGFQPLAAKDNLPFVGATLPKLILETPAEEGDKKYLGLGKGGKFSLQQVEGTLLLVEIIGVYCPLCHKQAPGFNRLFQRIQKDPRLKAKVKFLAVAAGGTATEIAYLRREFAIPFPIVNDARFEVHKQLGEPRTPFTMLLDRNRKVLFAHLGVIEDLDSFFQKIAGLVP
ncbi:MAG: TlpA family protein disulfide reductase [Deltaproteobacteria bacterium]|nr:TlpA family protein disulfide reductase [Deltaproteobacteria bacterium]